MNKRSLFFYFLLFISITIYSQSNSSPLDLTTDGTYIYVVNQKGTIYKSDKDFSNTVILAELEIPMGSALDEDIAANPWSSAFSKDGKKLFVVLGGTYELFSIEFDKMIGLVQKSEEEVDALIEYLLSI